MKIRFLVITAVLATALLCSGGAINAQTADVQAQITQLQAMIQSLLQQIASLQAQQSGTQAWCHTFNSNLGFVNSGSTEVGDLKTALIKNGVWPYQAVTYGYDEETAAYVVQFQAKYGILQSGYVGPVTRAKLNALYGCGTTLPPITSCTPNWTCGWGSCTNGWQQKTAIDSNNCGVYSANAIANCTDLSKQACTPSSSAITITSPNGGENWKAGETHNITWTGGNPNVASYSVYIVGQSNLGPNSSMYLGTAYPRADGTVGTFSWTIPTTMQSGSNYQIQFINGTTSVGKSLSFTITSTTSTQPSITVGYPNGGETVLLGASGGGNDFRTTWTSSNLSGSVSIYLNFADGGTCLLGTAPVSQGYFLTTLGSNYQCSNISRSVTPGQYKVLLNTDTRDTDPNSLFGIHDTSDNYFTIATAGMVCGGGAVVGTTQACNAGLGVGVQTCQANGAWSSCVVSAQPSITVTSPNGGESWTQGGTYNIRWTSNGVSNVMIVLENSNTSNGWHLNYSVPASAGLYSWTVPSSVAAGSGYKITIWDNTSSSIIDSSNNTFTIATSGAICTPGITMACNAGAGAGTQTCNSSGQWGSCVVNQLPIIVNVTANGSAGPIIPVQIGSLISIAWTSTGDAETCSVSATPEDSSINLWYTGSSGSISVHQGAPITTYTVNCYKGINTANVQQGFNSITLQTSSASACTGTAPSAGQILCPGTDQSISAPWHEVGDGLNNCCGVAGHPCNQCSYYTPAIIMKYPTK